MKGVTLNLGVNNKQDAKQDATQAQTSWTEVEIHESGVVGFHLMSLDTRLSLRLAGDPKQ